MRKVTPENKFKVADSNGLIKYPISNTSAMSVKKKPMIKLSVERRFCIAIVLEKDNV